MSDGELCQDTLAFSYWPVVWVLGAAARLVATMPRHGDTVTGQAATLHGLQTLGRLPVLGASYKTARGGSSLEGCQDSWAGNILT